ncbi:TetR/AcrR family transcriptional regulator [Amycolatopsis anabasis]|uniref:TetR/AcrR family transcriptional regulator n=1 Tax=Amycolatopsis anabasis TaxID=1840409 RepID=UPI00131D1333|nr:TetR/AcrR family transcriptional regulator [Amycolatopsis anabasis]
MGNREALLSGAKRCLAEKGYARTTARDIATAAGTSLAAIGYHFRTTEALLNAALFEAVEELGAEIQRALEADLGPGATPLDRFEAVWTRLIASFTEHRALWATQLELVTQVAHVPEIRELLTRGLREARTGLAELIQRLDPVADEAEANRIGSLYQALLSGVLVQWLVDPESAPSGADLAQALRAVAANLTSPDA